jgi:2-oxoisovalerate dehydrogenase E2 component (dihydrolipoyl transacylase)
VARYAFKLPDIGEGIAEAEIVAWHVAVGDVVEEDAPLADLMTDKATVEMTSPVAGKVIEIAGAVGDQIAIGSVLAVFDAEGEGEATVAVAPNDAAEVVAQPPARPFVPSEVEAPAPPPQHASTSLGTNGRVLASPAVRARAKDLGIDLATVKPAQGDRIRHADLDAFLTYNQAYRPSGGTRPDETVKVIGLRRRIAENMAASKRHIPHFTYVEEIDVTKLEALRADLNDTRGDRPKLTLLPLLIVAICRAIPDFPMINARYDDEAGVVTRYGAVHLGMATQTNAGLMVPVIRDAQDRNIWQLATEIVRLAEAARSGKAKSEELSGSTLTITSLGPLGGIATTPVINRPEVAIIGPNKVVERPVIRDGEIAIAKLMNLSISCDHRVVDGWDAASYVQALKRLLETPALLFVD